MVLNFDCEKAVIKAGRKNHVNIEIAYPEEGFLKNVEADNIIFHSNKYELLNKLIAQASDDKVILHEILNCDIDDYGYLETFIMDDKSHTAINILSRKLKEFIEEAKQVCNEDTEIELHGGDHIFQKDLIIKSVFNYILNEINY